jgi:hypothetical protein
MHMIWLYIGFNMFHRITLTYLVYKMIKTGVVTKHLGNHGNPSQLPDSVVAQLTCFLLHVDIGQLPVCILSLISVCKFCIFVHTYIRMSIFERYYLFKDIIFMYFNLLRWCERKTAWSFLPQMLLLFVVYIYHLNEMFSF